MEKRYFLVSGGKGKEEGFLQISPQQIKTTENTIQLLKETFKMLRYLKPSLSQLLTVKLVFRNPSPLRLAGTSAARSTAHCGRSGARPFKEHECVCKSIGPDEMNPGVLRKLEDKDANSLDFIYGPLVG